MTKKIIKIELHLLLILTLIAGLVIYNDYTSRPGLLKVDALQVSKRTADSVHLKWEPVRNTDKYIVTYKPKEATEWTEVEISGEDTAVEIEDLDEGVEYDFALRADSSEREGLSTDTTTAATKKHQTIEGKTKQMKLANNKIDLNLESETNIKIETEDEAVKVDEDNQTIEVTEPGTVKLTAIAEEDDDFVEDEVEVEVEVLDSVSEETDDASIHTLYSLDETNCEMVKAVTGSGKAIVPQSFGYADNDYIIAYGMHDSQKIVTYSEDEKTVSNPKVALGHPNGFAYCDKNQKGYCVKGWGGRCVVYTPEDDSYDIITLPYGASGIAYDREKEWFYTSARNILVAYDTNFEVISTVAPVSHKGTYFTQDCGGHAGILMRCLSDKSKHGINLIDLYDMVNLKYLGTVECDLSEVESAIVYDEGYMELLCNTKKNEDYIWKTPINIDDLGADL